jgi:hypothetical protein
MLLLHGYPPAAVADIFHGRQFVFADMGMVNTGSATEAAFFLIAAGIAQMPRLIGHGTTIFACIGHRNPPFLIVNCNLMK